MFPNTKYVNISCIFMFFFINFHKCLVLILQFDGNGCSQLVTVLTVLLLYLV